MPDVEVARSVFRPGVQAVLRKVSEAAQRTVVQAVTISVASSERDPVGEPLGQGRLQAVVVGTGIVDSCLLYTSDAADE